MEGCKRMKLISMFVKVSISFACVAFLMFNWFFGIGATLCSNTNRIDYYLLAGLMLCAMIILSIGIFLIIYYVWSSDLYELEES